MPASRRQGSAGPGLLPLVLLLVVGAHASPDAADGAAAAAGVRHQQPAALGVGVGGAVTAVPPGHTVEVAVVAGAGIRDTYEAWGDALLRFHGKERTPHNHDVFVSHLGYALLDTAPFCAMGEKIDFVYLIATMPGRHSGAQVHKAKKNAAPWFLN